MPISSTSRSGFAKPYDARQVNDAWRSRIRAATQSYLNDTRNVQTGLITAWNNQITGSASLAAQAAVTRIKAATAAVAKTADSLNLSV